MDTNSLLQILKATLSTDAPTRRSAESTFLSSWVPHPDTLFPALLSIMSSHEGGIITEEMQCTAAVFFRRWIARGSADDDRSAAFFHLSDAKAIQSGLLAAFTGTAFKSVRNRIADAIGQVASISAAYEEWHELVQLIISSLQGGGKCEWLDLTNL